MVWKTRRESATRVALTAGVVRVGSRLVALPMRLPPQQRCDRPSRSARAASRASPREDAHRRLSRLLTDGVDFTAMPTELATERFTLTREEVADAAWLADLFTARADGTVTEAEARSRIAAMHELTSAHGIGAYVLRPRGGGRPAGYAAVVIGRGSTEEPELGLRAPSRRTGPWVRHRSVPGGAGGGLRHGPATDLGHHPALERGVAAGPGEARRLPPGAYHSDTAGRCCGSRARGGRVLLAAGTTRSGRGVAGVRPAGWARDGEPPCRP